MVDKFIPLVDNAEQQRFAVPPAEHHEPPPIWKAAYEGQGATLAAPGGERPLERKLMTDDQVQEGAQHVLSDLGAGKFGPDSAKFFRDFYANSLAKNSGDQLAAMRDLVDLRDGINEAAKENNLKNSLVFTKSVQGNRLDLWYTMDGPDIDSKAQFNVTLGATDTPTAIKIGGFEKPTSGN